MLNRVTLFFGFIALLGLCSANALAGAADPGDFLVKFKPGKAPFMVPSLVQQGATMELLGGDWARVQVKENSRGSGLTSENSAMSIFRNNPNVAYVQPNYKVGLIEDYKVKDAAFRRELENLAPGDLSEDLLSSGKKKPQVPAAVITPEYGPDPLEGKQWGMAAIHAPEAWKVQNGDRRIVVAVIDTGVDYTHPDLAGNIWRNSGEIFDNGKDDDGNGYVDDVAGWDFADNDNKPFDVTSGIISTLLIGGNPGHGTHCAGNIGAVGNNSIGISGVAPNVSIMPVRFLNARGQGTTAGAVKAINYAVANGAKILSNSWGEEGESPSENNQALKDAITNAMNHGVLFIAAAGNGHMGVGYDNDNDSRPAIPASYKIDNIISVAAVDSKGHLGSFSNWGAKSVHVAAPGVAVYSTMTRGRYSDAIFKIGRFKLPWDGTSMATPHVAGAAAMIWAAHPDYTWKEVKAKLISSVTPLDSLKGKTVSGGIINVSEAIK